MRHNRTSQALRRAVALPFSLLACGGATAVPTVDDGGPTHAGPPDSGKTDVGPMDDASPADAPSPIDAPGLACAVASGSGDASDNPNSPPCCFVTFALIGPADACKPAPDGFLSNEQCTSLCPSNPWGRGGGGSCQVSSSATPNAVGTLRCSYFNCPNCQAGRRPEGLLPPLPCAPSEVASVLAKMAWLEAASIPAFERLVRELEAQSAPAELSDAAKRAARDEVRHALAVTALAEEAGARVPEVRVAPFNPRSLEAIATENAVEGCVRETFGAAVAAVQAKRAHNPRVLATMKRVARDEARHAQLSWAVADWIDCKLDADARRRVREARESAWDELLQGASIEPCAAVSRELGMPSAAEARAMALSLRASMG